MTHHQPEHDDTVNPTTASPDREETGPDWANTGGPAGSEATGSAGSWSGGGRWSGSNASASAQAWLTQLQAIIDNLATQSAPVVREVGAKAAEIAAMAAERAGPLALRAADATAQATIRVAERSRNFAADLRRPGGDAGGGEDAWSQGAPQGGNDSSENGGSSDTTAPAGPTV